MKMKSSNTGDDEKGSEMSDPQGMQDAGGGGGEAVSKLRSAIQRYNSGEMAKAEREAFLCTDMYRLTVAALTIHDARDFDGAGAAEAIRDLVPIVVQALRTDIHLAHILASILFKADLRFWAFLPARLPLTSSALTKSVNSAPYTSRRGLPQMPLLSLSLPRYQQQQQQQQHQLPEGVEQIYVDLINYFGILGGFDVILDHISPRSATEDEERMLYVPVHILNQDLRSLQYVRDALSTSFGVPYAQNVCDAAFATLLHYYRNYETLGSKETAHFREAFFLYKDLLHYASRGAAPVRFEDFRLFLWDACTTLRQCKQIKEKEGTIEKERINGKERNSEKDNNIIEKERINGKERNSDNNNNNLIEGNINEALKTVTQIIATSSTRNLFISSGYRSEGSSSCAVLFDDKLQRTRYDDDDEEDNEEEEEEDGSAYDYDEYYDEDDDGTGSTSSTSSTNSTSSTSSTSSTTSRDGDVESYNVSYGDIIPGSLVLGWLCEVDIVGTILNLGYQRSTRLSTPILVYMLQSVNTKDIHVVDKIWIQSEDVLFIILFTFIIIYYILL